MPTILGNANAIVAVPLTIAGGGGPIKPVEFFILAENGDKCITEVGTNFMVQVKLFIWNATFARSIFICKTDMLYVLPYFQNHSW